MLKDRELRFASLAELAQALEPFAPERAKTTVDRIVGMCGPLPDRSSSRDLGVRATLRDGSRPSGSRTGVAWGRHARRDAGARAFAAIGAIGLVVTGVYAWLREPIADARVHSAAIGLEHAAATAHARTMERAEP